MKKLTAVLLGLVLAGCSSSSIQYQNSTYQYVAKRTSWHEAKAEAEKLGGRLAIFETVEELMYLESQIPRRRIAWVGLTDEKVEGDWTWLNGTRLSANMRDRLERGRGHEFRDYGYILLQGGLGSRADNGELPRGAHGRPQVDGFVVEFEQ
ncbi:C-type lectin domain-containing protein [Microbulbifer bruguierae]|uniref:C-type lectin domain-containing protein n=1 Tax=Microbulbifer bruguierae TaxID=3029061 RepID=A0ABY8NBK9_9GAMM|nr:C-type lectin domain-containing protein [Microbulbifer bruguierae]WGL16075.1 C-type lectin domain-containing protein [Microbulbifer bruguierae]